ncbi:MAG: EAL domain-containing protein, partial [Butyrivibrio sp.]|nr:EAL domain-containing protein [Butyrivibrio sp.]
VLFPLRSRNHLLGYMWAINFDASRSVEIKETLEITTFIVASELGNYLLLERLSRLNSLDMLTGVLNRNEMNKYVDSLSHGEAGDTSVGVIFASLNGIKAINDFEGHNSGDLLLKNAASALKDVFEADEIFRAGGDEFAVITTDITAEELEERIEDIRFVCGRYGNLLFALGGYVEKDSRNVRMALKNAGERMYEDKRRITEQLPESMAESRDRINSHDETDADFRENSIFQEINYDHLTGLPSMTYFFRLAEAGRKSMHERDVPSAMLFINLNGLKYYNRKYGFAEGDELIKDVARIIAGQFGEERCSRFGQDHFAVFTEIVDLEKKLKKIFREARGCNGGKTLPVRVGIYPDSMGIVEASLACDRAKYACDAIKDEYNSCYNYFDDTMLQREVNRQYIIDNLDRAISENWIKAFFQPIVRAANGRVCDEEALARWIDPNKGMLSPAEFIPILEDTRLIYKMDLYMLDLILERIKNQRHAGLDVVPISVNLSRTDFEMCDIVEEITNRTDAAGVSRELITIEITESVMGENFEFMREQVGRFQSLGFQVWMDDFGSGYSSLDLLQEIQFDLIKFDMRFMRQFENSPKSRIILKELMRMALNLGTETVCEGVETSEQVEFLQEIGCTKLQGYYFCKPIPYEDILERNRKGIAIGFENPAEAPYYSTISAINLYDLGSVTSEYAQSIKHYFDTVPMAVVEYDRVTVRIIRCSRSYKEFMRRYFGIDTAGRVDSASEMSGGAGAEFLEALERCAAEGSTFVNERMEDGSTVHSMLKMITEDPVRHVQAFAVAVLGIIPEDEQQITYANVAQALSSDYVYLYYIDTESGAYTRYAADGSGNGLSAIFTGSDFFGDCARDISSMIHPDDQEKVQAVYSREQMLQQIDDNGALHLVYRMILKGEPTYMSMKAVRMGPGDRHVIIGINNVDYQMRQRETLERLNEEKATYSRITALMGEFIVIYSIDPVSGNYMEYSSSDEYAGLGLIKAGLDFFGDALQNIVSVIHPEDLDYFRSVFSREQVLNRTESGRVYKISYRLRLNGEYARVSLRAGLVKEKDGPQLIVGLTRSAEAEE